VLAAALGPGFLHTSSGTTDRRHFSGPTLSLEVLVGGHLGHTFSLGGALLRDQVFGLTLKDSNPKAQLPNIDGVSFAVNSVALFGDWRLQLGLPELHVQGFLGYARLHIAGRPAAADDAEPSGILYAAALSTEFRLAEHATLGVAARITYVPMTVTEVNATDVDTLVPALLVTGRYD